MKFTHNFFGDIICLHKQDKVTADWKVQAKNEFSYNDRSESCINNGFLNSQFYYTAWEGLEEQENRKEKKRKYCLAKGKVQVPNRTITFLGLFVCYSNMPRQMFFNRPYF